MPQPENTSHPDPPPKESGAMAPAETIICVDGPGDTTVRPSRVPLRLPVPREELDLHGQHIEVVCADGPGDTTVRPRPANVPVFWPKDIPLPGKPPHPPLGDRS